MSACYSEDDYEVVFMKINGRIDKEMMYTEFESILDSFLAYSEFAGQEVQCAYLIISPKIKIKAAVFFLIGFDGAGNPDPRWNVPLRQLANEGMDGPDLGGGPIKLCCRSQTSVNWADKDLWDPDMDAKPNDFVLLRDVVQRNKMSLQEKSEDEDNVVSDEEYQKYMPTNLKSGLPLYVNEEISEGDQVLANSLVQFIKNKIEEDQKEYVAQMKNKHRLLLSVQKTRFEDDIHKMSKDHASVLRDLQTKMDNLNKTLENEKARSSELKIQLEEEMLRVEKAWKIYEARMAESELEDSEQIESMRKQFEEETDHRVRHAIEEMKYAMKEKEDKIADSKKNIAGLKEHIKELQNDAAKLISQGGQAFLDRLDQNDVSFVVYHPGAGHINIALKHIGTYLENPLGYAAQHCKVEEDIYREWLIHHEKPVCDAYSDVKKETCNKKLKLVVSPSQFVPGRSNRCPMHWSFAEENTAKA